MHIEGLQYAITMLQYAIIIFQHVPITLQKSAFERTKEEFGAIDIVCNNAGISKEDEWRKMLDINLVYDNNVLLLISWSNTIYCCTYFSVFSN